MRNKSEFLLHKEAERLAEVEEERVKALEDEATCQTQHAQSEEEAMRGVNKERPHLWKMCQAVDT